MNHGIKTFSLVLILIFTTPYLAAAPGTPIGGIIVKGGKNPGGQMLAKATTDSAGNFTIDFAEGGEYKLVFEQPQPVKNARGRNNHDMQLDYTVQTTNNSARQTPFQKKIENGAFIINVPAGGATIKAVLRSANLPTAQKPAPKGINETGIK